MRFEIHLILWVTAIVITTASLFIGRHDESRLSSLDSASIALKKGNVAPVSGEPGENNADQPKLLPSINKSARSLFSVISPSQTFQLPPTDGAGLPVVVGIFSTADRLAAVIAESGGPQTELVEEGDAVGRFVIKHISMDGIVLENTADGTQNSILLRGAGELP